MNSCEFVTLISTLACSIAKGKKQDEIDILAVFLLNFGDTLTTISTVNSNCTNKAETTDKESLSSDTDNI